MTWQALGSIVLTKKWQLINSPTINTTTFRVTQSWDIYPAGARCYISQVYFNGDYLGARAFWPSDKPKLMRLPIPPDFLNRGINTRYLALKFFQRRQFTFQWTITIEEFS